MEITKFKKMSKGRYNVYFDNLDKLVIFDEVILKYNLLSNKNIDLKKLKLILKENEEFEAFNLAIDYIKLKQRTENEISNYLLKKNFNEKIICSVVNRLKKLNLLNELIYIQSFINDRINLTNHGPEKIKKDLIDKGFLEKDINNYLGNIDNIIFINKIKKIIEKSVRINKKYSSIKLKNNIKNNLYKLGYDIDMINDNLNFDIKIDNKLILDAYKKIENKYNKKFKGDKLLLKIKNEMFKLGYEFYDYKDLI